MKLKDIKTQARARQEKIVTKACAEYYKKEGGICDQTIDVLNGMLDNLEVTDKEQILSAIAFAEAYAEMNFKKPEPDVKYEKAKKPEEARNGFSQVAEARASKVPDVADTTRASATPKRSTRKTKPTGRKT